MGQRGELFSTRVFAEEGRKTFFFNVKENRYRDLYLNIVESRKTDAGFRRSSVVVFSEDLRKFQTTLNSCLREARSGELKPCSFDVGGGRRTYEFRMPPRGRRALQVSESREDSAGTRRESIMIPLSEMPIILEGMNKAVDALRDAIQR
ncbi:MAG: DUF3276 family protein [Spirochaetales bacterium]|nr:DUF3276 family protein [Spirochaetales bacterium]